MMNSHERVLRALHFEPVDRPPYDLMEGCVWPELMAYFHEQHGLDTPEQVYDFLDTDFRWTFLAYDGPSSWGDPTYRIGRAEGPLAGAQTVADVAAYPWPDPAWWQPADYAAFRHRWPDKALAFCPGWMPLFWGACEAFGAQEGLIKMITQPALFEAFIERQHAFYMDILTRGARAAAGWCDICWLGDDFASQQAMLIRPDLWRKMIKPYLAEQVRVARENGMLVLFHSCGAVRPVLPDLIEIGVNALLVFQTSARGMDPVSIAHDFGGRLAFYGGIDVQRLLVEGTPEEVGTTVRANATAFAGCGGYIVANSHHTLPNIKGENIIAMCAAARRSD